MSDTHRVIRHDRPPPAVRRGCTVPASRKRRVVAVAIASTFAAVVSLATAPPSIALTASVSAATLVTGRLLAGSVPVAGAPVEVVAWPNQDTLAALPTGQRIDDPIVETTTTAQDGSYALA